MRIYTDRKQYSEEWWAMRRGKPTASQFHRIITSKGHPSAQAREYMYKLIAERLLGETMDETKGQTLYWPERGRNLEQEALEKFSQKEKITLKKISFVESDDGRIGCSPDCLVDGSNEAIEIKCPAPWTQIGYLLDGPGNDYKQQVQGQLLIGEWEAVHFFTYHPQMPYTHLRTLRDEDFIKTMDRLLFEFCDELDYQTERARRLGDYVPHAERPIVWPWGKRGGI